MNELQLRAWLADEAPVTTPDRLRVRVAAIPVDVATGWGALPALTMRRTSRLLLVAAVLAALLVAALIVGALLRTPFGRTSAYITSFAWSPDGSQLAFSVGGRRDDGGTTATYEALYAVGADGRSPRLIARVDGAGMPLPAMLSWSPDGRYVAFGSKVEDLARSTSIELADGSGNASMAGWLTGDRVLYEVRSAVGVEIFSIERDGRDRTALSPEDGSAQVDAVSPDGSRILYRTWNGGEVTTNTVFSGWVMDADGSGKVQLSSSVEQLAWAEHGSRVYMWADAPYGSAASVIDSVNPNGTDRRVVQGPWQALVYTISSEDGSYAGQGINGGIVIGTLGEAPRVITTDPGDALLSVSPDGKWLAFLGSRPDAGGVFVVPSTGGSPQLVAPNVDENSGGTDDVWQPHASGMARFAFIRNGALSTIAADGSDLRTVVPRTAISDRVVEPPFDGTFDDRMVIGPNGPDRDVYHFPRRSELTFTIENRTDTEWEVVFGPGGGPADCEAIASDVSAPAFVEPRPTPPASTATGGQSCRVRPNGATAVQGTVWTSSSYRALARPWTADASAPWWAVTFDFEPAPLRTSTTAP